MKAGILTPVSGTCLAAALTAMAALPAAAGMIASSDGLAIEGGAWSPNSREALVGWTVLAGDGITMRGSPSTATFASTGQTTLELGNFGVGSSRLGRDFFRNAASSLDTNGPDLDASYSWFTDGDAIDLSGAGDNTLNLTSGLTDGSNWAFIKLDSAPTNYTGHSAALGGVTEAAIEIVWDDVDSSGGRTTGDTYDIGRVIYATDGDGGSTFSGGSWDGGAPVVVPEPGSLGLLTLGVGGLLLRRRGV